MTDAGRRGRLPPGIAGLAANELARARLSMAATVADVSGDDRRLLQDWLGGVDLWGSGAPAAAFSTASSIHLDELAWRVSGRPEELMPRVTATIGRLGVAPDALDTLVRLGEISAPTRCGIWLQVGSSGIDAGWTVPERVLVDDLLGVGVPRPMREWLGSTVGEDVTLVEGGFGADAFLGAAVELTGDATTAEETAAVVGSLGASSPPADLLVALEALHRGPLWLSVWFVAGEGPVKVGLLASEPSAELLVACAMACDADEDRLAAYGAALGQAVPTAIELESWADGPNVRLHHDVPADDPNDVPADDPNDAPADDQVK